MEKKETQYRLGIVLSGGGARGFAHIGVLKALNEAGIYPDIFSGVSAGSIVGAFYADGFSPDEILEIFSDHRFFNYMELIFPKRGLLKITGLLRVITQHLRAKTFEDLKIPLIINATELVEGKNVYFTTGTLIDKIVASASVPIFLNPAEIDGKIFVDGGIFCNMPAKIIRPKCETLIGVHVNPILSEGKIDSVSDVLERVYHLVIQANTIAEKKVCDIVIEPVKARNFGMFEISKSQQLFDIGYDAAMQTLSTLFNKSSKK